MDAGILDAALTEDAKRMARFRSRMVHVYWNLDVAEVYRILRGRLDDFDRFFRAIETHLGR